MTRTRTRRCVGLAVMALIAVVFSDMAMAQEDPGAFTASDRAWEDDTSATAAPATTVASATVIASRHPIPKYNTTTRVVHTAIATATPSTAVTSSSLATEPVINTVAATTDSPVQDPATTPVSALIPEPPTSVEPMQNTDVTTRSGGGRAGSAALVIVGVAAGCVVLVGAVFLRRQQHHNASDDDADILAFDSPLPIVAHTVTSMSAPTPLDASDSSVTFMPAPSLEHEPADVADLNASVPSPFHCGASGVRVSSPGAAAQLESVDFAFDGFALQLSQAPTVSLSLAPSQSQSSRGSLRSSASSQMTLGML